MDDDCLFLNVYTPAADGGKRAAFAGGGVRWNCR